MPGSIASNGMRTIDGRWPKLRLLCTHGENQSVTQEPLHPDLDRAGRTCGASWGPDLVSITVLLHERLLVLVQALALQQKTGVCGCRSMLGNVIARIIPRKLSRHVSTVLAKDNHSPEQRAVKFPVGTNRTYRCCSQNIEIRSV
jgi:hypothetical protein